MTATFFDREPAKELPAHRSHSKRILHVIVGLNSGGAERTLRNLLLSDSVHHHSVVSLTSRGTYGEELLKAGIPVDYLGMSRSPLDVIRCAFTIRDKILNVSPDIIQTWMYHADFIGSLSAIFAGHRNIFWNLRASEPKLGKTRATTLMLIALLSLLSWFVPRKIIAVGASVKKAHARLGYRSSKILVVQNGVDVNQFRADPKIRGALRASLSIPSEMLVIGLVGRLDPQKNHAGFLRACEKLFQDGREFRIIFAGEGAELSNSEFSRLIAKTACGPYIFALGKSYEVLDVMNAIDFLVLPSRYGEGFPNVVLEAMACERPCIVSDSGDSRAIIGDLGWSFSRKSFRDMCDKISDALSISPDERTLLGVKSANRVGDKFPLRKMVKNYQTLYSL